MTVDVPEAGDYLVEARYANGSGPVNTDNKAAIRSLFVDGSRAGSIVMPQRGDGLWTDWGWSNAVRVSFDASTHTLSLRFTPADGGGATLSVEDSGYGIPEPHLTRLTERFYRVSSSRTRETGGTGLGLAIVKHVLQLHQARLDIASEVGRGSTFTCRFGAERVIEREDDLHEESSDHAHAG